MVVETLNSADIEWSPQGEIYVTSGKKLQMPDRKEAMPHEDPLDATRPYTYSDYDGESLTLKQQNQRHGPFVTAEYRGEGPVFFGGTDDVLRTALALIVRGADKELPYLQTVMLGLVGAINAIEAGRQYKRGQTVEVYTDWDDDWCKGEVMGYYDDGEYAILPEGCGVYISYATKNIRELQKEN